MTVRHEGDSVKDGAAGGAATDTIVWVLAEPDDPGLAYLRDAPRARLIVGRTLADFAHAPAAQAVLSCGGHRDDLDAVVRALPELTWVHVRAAGIEKAVRPDLGRPGLRVTNGRGVFGAALAEFAIGALLYFLKDYPRLLRQQRAAEWRQFQPQMLAGRSLGVVGYGDIGRCVAALARPLGVRIHALRRDPTASAGDPLVDRLFAASDLVELCRESDDVVVVMPLTPATRGFVDEEAIAALRPGAIFVNIGRGATVDEAALEGALRQRRIRGAALDVFETEPLPADSPFYALDNVLLSPHCADHVTGYISEPMAQFRRNLELFQAGRPFPSTVDPARGY